MTHIDIQSALDLRGRTVLDREGEKLGTLKEVFLDESERPAWASVHTGLFGLRESFVPLADVRRTGDDVQVPYTRAEVKDAPSVDPDVQLAPEEEDRLLAHYGGGSGPAPATSDVDRGGGRGLRAEGVEEDDRDERVAPAPAAADRPRAEGEDEVVRSEEEVDVGTRVRERKVRLRKVLVDDVVTKQVPVQREEIVVEEVADDEDVGRR